MKLTYKLSFLIGLVLILSSFKSEESQFFVQFKINTELNKQMALEIDQKMRLKTGIKISRTDVNSNTYLAVLEQGIDFNEQNFIVWFNELGYQISCFNKLIYNQDKLISPNQLKNC